MLLSIETEQLSAPLKFENLEGGAILFPHLYGPLNLEAVAAVIPSRPSPTAHSRFRNHKKIRILLSQGANFSNPRANSTHERTHLSAYFLSMGR